MHSRSLMSKGPGWFLIKQCEVYVLIFYFLCFSSCTTTKFWFSAFHKVFTCIGDKLTEQEINEMVSVVLDLTISAFLPDAQSNLVWCSCTNSTGEVCRLWGKGLLQLCWLCCQNGCWEIMINICVYFLILPTQTEGDPFFIVPSHCSRPRCIS